MMQSRGECYILLMVNNFDSKQNRYGSGKINVKKTANLGHNTSFFCKNRTTTYPTATPGKSFYDNFGDI